jgi:hypothetical protein
VPGGQHEIKPLVRPGNERQPVGSRRGFAGHSCPGYPRGYSRGHLYVSRGERVVAGEVGLRQAEALTFGVQQATGLRPGLAVDHRDTLPGHIIKAVHRVREAGLDHEALPPRAERHHLRAALDVPVVGACLCADVRPAAAPDPGACTPPAWTRPRAARQRRLLLESLTRNVPKDLRADYYVNTRPCADR